MTTESGKTASATSEWWAQPTAGTPTTEVAHDTEVPAAERPAATSKPKHAKLKLDGAKEAQVLRCPVCSRTNPAHAYYCHFDGKPLFKELQQMPLRVGSLNFPTPFCFSNGQACTNFNQLALACNNHWEEARTLLTEGIWSTFFASMGRLDLAAAAKQAAQLPDLDRGLSDLLEKFPVDPEFLHPPKLAMGCSELNLGQLTPGTDYTFDLAIHNQGLGLLRGIVLSHFDWLVLGERAIDGASTGPREKIFQTRCGCTIPVRILGSKLHAGAKPLLGEIIVDSNAGSATLPIRANVPVRLFPKTGYANDVLAGVGSPRELATRAKQFPDQAGQLFERGAVKAWYASNGWNYPIEGADGIGAGAVQQFFEALGLTKPPRLEIDTRSLAFQGKIGQSWLTHITLRTRDAKPVYAQAWSNREWAKVGPLKYLGTKVQIPVEVSIPADVGKLAQAELTIRGNARQHIVVPITIAVKRH